MLLKHLQKIQQEHDIQQDGTGVEPEVIQPTVIKVFSWYYIVTYALFYIFKHSSIYSDRYVQVNSDTMQ